MTTDQVSEYIIQDYEFSVKGKTKDFALRSVVVPAGGDPVFLTEQAMMDALLDKKQLLLNKRIFTDVEVAYSLDSYSKGKAYYVAKFTVEDAATFLIIPYPKFDNDTVGLRLGVKMYDKNLFGSFSDLYISGTVSQGNGGLTGWDKRQDAVELKISSLPIGKSFLGFSFNYFRENGSPDPGDFDFSLDWDDVKIFGANLNISPWGYFAPSSDFSTWNPEEAGIQWTLGPFRQNESLFSLTNKIRYYEGLTRLYTYTYLEQLDLTFFGHPLNFRLFMESEAVTDSDTFDYMNVGASLGTGFSLPFGLSWSTSVAPTLHYSPMENPVPYSYLFTNSVSKSNINWHGNFRKGASFSLTYLADLYPQDEYWATKTSWSVESTVKWFPFVTSWFNPSIQVTGFIADPKGKDLYEEETIADSLRGYLTSTIEDLGLEGLREYGAIINMNLTTTFIDFGFAKSYASPFVDIGIFPNPENLEKPIILSTAGLDGWAIVNKFPSYPIRGSLGFNLSSVRKAIDNEIKFTEIEFELFIGMGMFF
ncbi:hypothetical protein [Sphaerochaeta sp. PS]|uniref:hypothetical protein n=1 Tax=Sphaerochaeta sp. PS TaxID=3076336 RepID=UPI0028A571D5|nr:hypothetical protein [Sphaerochaeta sp. PS]MDT4761989.1 hypothetical protein [Sphaerochaeta sp. PS]